MGLGSRHYSYGLTLQVSAPFGEHLGEPGPWYSSQSTGGLGAEGTPFTHPHKDGPWNAKEEMPTQGVLVP